MRFNLVIILMLVTFSSFLITSCGNRSENSATPSDAAAPAEGGGGGHIRQGQADMRNDTTPQTTPH